VEKGLKIDGSQKEGRGVQTKKKETGKHWGGDKESKKRRQLGAHKMPEKKLLRKKGRVDEEIPYQEKEVEGGKKKQNLKVEK